MRFWVVLCFLIALILSASAAAQPQLGVQVIPPPSKTTTPGDFVTLVFIVINRGAVPDSYDLQAALPEGFQLVGISPPSVTLNPGAQESIFLTLFVRPTARAGPHEIKLKATSRTDPAVTATGVAIVEVLPAAGIVIQPPPGQRAKPGDTVLYIFAVINRGNVLDIFELSARSSNNFLVTVAPDRVQLVPGERAEVQVTLRIPSAARTGRDTLLFRATSTTTPGVFAEARVLTTILPLAFEQVPIFLGLELPSLLTLFSTIEPIHPPILDSLTTNLLITGELPDDMLLSSTIPVSILPAFSLGAFSLSLRTGPAPDFPPSSFVGLPTHISLFFLDPSLSLGLFLSQGSLRRALRAALPLEMGTVGLVALRDEVQDLALLDIAVPLTLKIEMIPASLFLEAAGAIGGAAGLFESAFRLGLSLNPAPSFMSFDFTLAGEVFGNRASFTGSFSFPLALDSLALSSGVVLSLEQTNISGDPTLPQIFTEKLQMSALASLEPFSFGAALSVEQRRGDGLLPTNRLAMGLSLHARVSIEMLSLSFSHAQTQEFDNIAMTRSDSSQQSIALTLRPAVGAFLTASFFQSSVNTTETSGITFSFGLTSLSLAIIQASFAGPTIGLSTTITFNIPFTIQIETIPVKGQVEGVVFIDKNDNDRFEPDEEGVPNLILTLDDSQALSDPQGRFRFPPTKPGTFLLNILELPAFAEPKIKLPLWVTVQLGQVTFIEIPMRRFSAITGAVFNDANRNGIRDPGEGGLGNVRIVLSGPQAPQQSITGPNGSFLFRVPPGEYKLILDITTLPKGFELTTPGEVSITLKPEEIVRVDFGAAERPRPIKFAPVADFIFKPERPKPGEAVTFDASASFDPDGEIVKYEWDFNNDGVIDATGKVVTHAFLTVGDFPVKLVVTDNDGLQNSATKIVSVRP